MEAAREMLEEKASDLKNEIRIGIHLDDVVIDGDKVQGDGLVIASSITSAADPGSILISESLYGAVKGVGHINAQPLGEKVLDDVRQTVRIYKLGEEGKTGVKGGKSWAKAAASRAKSVTRALYAIVNTAMPFRRKSWPNAAGASPNSRTCNTMPFMRTATSRALIVTASTYAKNSSIDNRDDLTARTISGCMAGSHPAAPPARAA